MYRITILILLFLFLFGDEAISVNSIDTIDTSDGWFVSLYVGAMSDSNLIEDIAQLRARYVNSTIYVLSIGKQLGSISESLTYEVEGQLGIHNGVQNHVESTAVIAIRYHPFPWDSLIDTSVAIGEGVSYATESPEIEIERHHETSKLLNYLYIETEFVSPRMDHLSLFFRIHHRSGIYGMFDGVKGGSNAVGGGIRCRY